jgi:membrane associated rhomboid family serine protease
MVEKNTSLQNSITLATAFAFLIWLLKLAEVVLGRDLHHLGVYPLSVSGLIGIVTAPLIHGSWQHLISNTLPVILLGSIMIYGYPKSRWWALGIIWSLSGLGVWLFARDSYHYGASGLTHGMFFYLFLGGIIRRDKRSIALLMVAFFMYGSMLLTIFPREPEISYEYHLFGAMAGVVSAMVFYRWDPKSVPKTYAWQQFKGDEEADDPIIGDQWKDDKQAPSEEQQPLN